MAYMLSCLGGFAVPARAGKYSVLGYSATVNDPTAASEFGIIDDSAIGDSWEGGRLLASISTNTKTVIARSKSIANGDGVLEWTAPEPIKTRHGISIIANNIAAGSMCVYVR